MYRKVICSNHVLEIYEYEREPLIPDKTDRDDGPSWESDYLTSGEMPEGAFSLWFPKTEEQVKRQNNTRSRNNIRRLCLANFDQHSKFITLTFAENVTDIAYANKELDKFMKRMRRRWNFKYIWVMEFQKRGAIHYHIMTDLPYIENKELNKIWGHGHVRINDITHVDNVGAYMIKYLLKDLNDTRLSGKKAYQSSQNMDKPIEFKGEDAEKIIELYALDQKKEIFTNSYDSEYLGKITYKEYNLKVDNLTDRGNMIGEHRRKRLSTQEDKIV